MREETGASLPAIIRAYTIAREVYDMSSLTRAIEALDYQVPSEIQYRLLVLVMRLVRRAARWFLRNYRGIINIGEMITRFKAGVDEFQETYPQVLPTPIKSYLKIKTKEFTKANVPDELIKNVSSTSILLSGLDIIEVAREYSVSIRDVADVHFQLGQALGLDWFREKINEYHVENHWQGLARASYRDDLDWQHRELNVSVIMQNGNAKTVPQRMNVWKNKYADLIERWQSMLTNLRETDHIDLVMLSVALKELLDLTQTTVSERERSVL